MGLTSASLSQRKHRTKNHKQSRRASVFSQSRVADENSTELSDLFVRIYELRSSLLRKRCSASYFDLRMGILDLGRCRQFS